MIKLFKKSPTTLAVVMALSLTGCTRFDNRMQANGDFDYQNAQLTPAYKTGAFSNDEARDKFNVPPLTQEQIAIGQLTKEVDIRPPTQLIPVIDGVLLAPDQQKTKIWFNDFKSGEDAQGKIWQLLKSYLVKNNISIISENRSLQQIETAAYTQKNIYGGFANRNEVVKTARYRFTLEKIVDSHSVALNVELLSYRESNDGRSLTFILADQNKRNIELQFVNNLLEFAYYENEADDLKNIDRQPLAIKLGFDDNHQISWIVDDDFSATWRKLPDLLSLLHFEITAADRNLGFFSLSYSAPDNDYWQENNLEPFALNSGEYFIQLGNMKKDKTSISWLDKDKKPLSDQKITDLYLSISDRMRSVLLQKEKQSKAL